MQYIPAIKRPIPATLMGLIAVPNAAIEINAAQMNVLA